MNSVDVKAERDLLDHLVLPPFPLLLTSASVIKVESYIVKVRKKYIGLSPLAVHECINVF